LDEITEVGLVQIAQQCMQRRGVGRGDCLRYALDKFPSQRAIVIAQRGGRRSRRNFFLEHAVA
jgi:hypothetical protein